MNYQINKCLAMAVVLLTSSMVFAVNTKEKDKNYYLVNSVETTELPLTDTDKTTLLEQSNNENYPKISPEDVSITEVVNLGLKIWNLIEKNQAVANLSMMRANALPQGSRNWTQLQSWSDPVAHKYRTQYKNVYGMTVAELTYILTYSYGGNVAGVGKYLSEIGFTVTNFNVAWGFKVDVENNVVRTLNVGTNDDPVGGVEMVLSWKLSSVMTKIQGAQNFYIRGDGKYSTVQ